MNYTKGEWKVNGTKVILSHPEYSDDGKVIASCNEWLAQESEANAHLIATAPEQNRALRASNVHLSTLLSIYEVLGGTNTKIAQDVLEQIRQNNKALTKAEGVVATTKGGK